MSQEKKKTNKTQKRRNDVQKVMAAAKTRYNKARRQRQHMKRHPNDLGEVRTKHDANYVSCYICGKRMSADKAVFILIDDKEYVFCQEHGKLNGFNPEVSTKLDLSGINTKALPKKHSEDHISQVRALAEEKAIRVWHKNAVYRSYAEDRQLYSEACGAAGHRL